MAELTPEENIKDRQDHLDANLKQVLSNNIDLYREMRAEKLEKLDVLWNKALERYFLDLKTDDENVKRIQQLALQKQALRDVTLTKVPSHIKDEIELMDYIPDALK
jgi:hypothetical protein|tara:strand:+ start:1456 stop:1773 length:318 start_codon:yes stop_codon:yes gene_type:complete